MKISKLFHWLYAILMFLPILVFIPNAFYYGFNKEAVSQEKTEQVPVYYESNVVDNSNDLHNDNLYHWNNNYTSTTTYSSYQYLFSIKWLNLNNYEDNFQDCRFYLSLNGTPTLQFLINNNYSFTDVPNIPFDFVFDQPLNNFNAVNDIITYFSESSLKLVKEYQPLITNMSISDSMSYAWNTTWTNDLFSWSYGSFLTQPFFYITNLFNVPATNTLLYCLSYWLNISIIWLCFDVVMYVPLLVHRWLDKGIIE